MPTTVGTSYFVSMDAAVRYYRDYHYPNTRESVQRKIAEGEIHIGKPPVKPGDTLRTIDNGTRYAIEERDYYELTTSDVGKPFITFQGHVWTVVDFIGRILPGDVGKRIYRRGDILQVENDAQRDARAR